MFTRLMFFVCVMMVSNHGFLRAEDSGIPKERLVSWKPGLQGDAPKSIMVKKLSADQLKDDAANDHHGHTRTNKWEIENF